MLIHTRGSTVLIPSTVQHSSSSAWGEDVGVFNHKRFVKETGRMKHNPVAFRAFGGGVALCPGRHFASTEILAFASVILLRFDIQPISGVWDTAGYEEANAAFRLPKQDMKVKLIPRDDKKWHVFFSEPGKPMEITEDVSAAIRDAEGNYSSEFHYKANINLQKVSTGWIGAVDVTDEMKMGTSF